MTMDAPARRGLAHPNEVAAYLGVPERTLQTWRYFNKGPRYSRTGKYVRYRWSDVEAWLDEHAQGGSAA